MKLLVVDTLGAAGSGDENDAKKGTVVMDNLIDLTQSLNRKLGTITIGHTTKGGAHGTWDMNKSVRLVEPKMGQMRGTGGNVALCRAAHGITFAGGDPANKNKRVLWNVRNSFRFEGLASPLCFEMGEDGVIRQCAMVPMYQPAAKEKEEDVSAAGGGAAGGAAEEEEGVARKLQGRPVDHFMRDVLQQQGPLLPTDVKNMLSEVEEDIGGDFDAMKEYEKLKTKKNKLVPIVKLPPGKDSVDSQWTWKLSKSAPEIAALNTPLKQKVAAAIFKTSSNASALSDAVASQDTLVETQLILSSSNSSASSDSGSANSDSDSD